MLVTSLPTGVHGLALLVEPGLVAVAALASARCISRIRRTLRSARSANAAGRRSTAALAG